MRKSYSRTDLVIEVVVRLLEGKNIRLRLRDREDLDFLFEFKNNIDYYGEYEAIQPQVSRTEAEKRRENPEKNGY